MVRLCPALQGRSGQWWGRRVSTFLGGNVHWRSPQILPIEWTTSQPEQCPWQGGGAPFPPPHTWSSLTDGGTLPPSTASLAVVHTYPNVVWGLWRLFLVFLSSWIWGFLNTRGYWHKRCHAFCGTTVLSQRPAGGTFPPTGHPHLHHSPTPTPSD